MRRALLICALLPWIGITAPIQAQVPPSSVAPTETAAPAMLVADRIFITPERTLIASGNVEALQGDIRLRAEKITYDRTDGSLQIEGPIRIDQGGEITILASAAELDRNLHNGLLSSARMVFQQQLQLAALQMTRVNGRFTQLYKTAVTSCHVCDDGRPPLWQIRAERVTHDQLARQLYFENAQLRVLDVPVFYFPALRLPDPTLKRATGFLIPSLRTTSILGSGVKVPYFFRLGDHKDLTLAPYVSPKTRTLEARYRQAFRSGQITIEGAHTRDDLQPGESRGYLFASGRFALPKGVNLGFDLKTVSDDAYLADYGLPDLDRLRSELTLTKARRDILFRSGVYHYKTLRDSEDQDLIPSAIADVSYQRRYFPQRLGGELRLSLEGHGHRRESQQPGTTSLAWGRDVTRLTADIDWRRSWRHHSGLVAEWRIGAAADAFSVFNDSSFASSETRLAPRSALTLRLPMTRHSPSGHRQYLEPIIQLGWSDLTGEPVPADESGFVEFDQGNLLALSRFPAIDAREEGLALVYGVNWARYAPDGWQAFATLGQVIRQDADNRFTKTSGLGGTSSDILMAGQLKMGEDLSLTARGLLNGSLNFSKAEFRGDWRHRKATLAGAYLWLGTDPVEGRSEETSEMWFDGSYQFSPAWRASASLRYDISDAQATRAGLGLVYSNECITVDLSLNRRYTSTTSLEPSTDFGFTIALNGFSVNNGNKKYRRSCSNT